MKLKKLPGFSLGLIALAVGNAYVTQLLDIYSIISYITDEESPIEIKNNTSTSNGGVSNHLRRKPCCESG